MDVSGASSGDEVVEMVVVVIVVLPLVGYQRLHSHGAGAGDSL